MLLRVMVVHSVSEKRRCWNEDSLLPHWDPPLPWIAFVVDLLDCEASFAFRQLDCTSLSVRDSSDCLCKQTGAWRSDPIGLFRIIIIMLAKQKH